MIVGCAPDPRAGSRASLARPKAYRRNKSQLQFVISPNLDIEWSDELADRGSTRGSDEVAWGMRGYGHPAYGIPTYVCGVMPEESGTSSNLGEILHTHPKNAIAAIHRDIFCEVDRDIRAGALVIVCSVRMDAQFEQVEGTVVVNNVAVS